MKAIWEGTLLAESDRTVVIEGNHCFPPNSVNREYLQPSEKHTTCHWKGVASYYHVQVGDKQPRMLLGTIPNPKPPLNR